MKRLLDLCTPQVSNIREKDLSSLGRYPCFGASGIAGYKETFSSDSPYIGVIKDGAGVGRVNVYPPKSSLLGTMQYLKPKEGVSVKYLMYLVRSLKLGETFQGSTIPHIYFKDYKNTQVRDRNFPEQEFIAESLASIEKSVENKKRQISELDSLVKPRLWGRRCIE
jgi:type I restriction enzyme S subunit